MASIHVTVHVFCYIIPNMQAFRSKGCCPLQAPTGTYITIQYQELAKSSKIFMPTSLACRRPVIPLWVTGKQTL